MEYIQSLGTVLFVFVVFIFVLFLAYKTTRFLGRKYSNIESGAKNIKILDKVSLSQTQSIVVAQVADKYLVLGCTDHSINNLCELSQENINIPVMPDTPPISFSAILEKVKKSKEGQQQDDKDS